MTDEWHSVIDAVIRERSKAAAEQIERACEAAIQGGQYGVWVQWGKDGELIKAEPNPMVPYGHIYEARSA